VTPPPSRPRPTIAVVGGGIAGLAAAWELVAGADLEGDDPPDVVVLESSDRIGGKLTATEFAGRNVDLAADAFLARRPEATGLCEELGLSGELAPVGALGASLWVRGRLRKMPEGVNLGVPTRWWPLFRSGILSTGESLRVARDLAVPHPAAKGVTGDRSVGDIVGERLGRPVVERLVDPLIGGIHAGGVDDLSAAATFPMLIAAARQPGSLMRRLGRVPAPPPGTADPTPVFWSLRGSIASLAAALGDALARRGVAIHTGVSVDAIARAGTAGSNGSSHPTWTITLGGSGVPPGRTSRGPDGTSSLRVDGVVLATPARHAGVMLAPLAPVAAGLLGTVEYASVALVTLALDPGAIRVPLEGTGFLVPRTSTIDGRPALITGCTYLGRKWPHLARPGDELMRVSVGRFGDDRPATLDDDELTAAAFGELARLLGIVGTPLETLVTRWDGAFPQYRVGHLIRVARIEQSVAELGGVAVAGATYRGVGIPACIGSGRTAARRVLESLSGGAGVPGGSSGRADPTR
jgi:oxygen-dependent protoporphyrinogen oxidase